MKNYSAWFVNMLDYPEKGRTGDKIKYFTRFGILAANIHNTQPWKFEIADNVLKIYPNKRYKLSVADPIGKNLYISLGCCIKNIECIASHHNYVTKIDFARTSKLDDYVHITFVRGKTSKDLSELAPYITKRFSNKFPYDGRKIEKSKLDRLKKINLPEDAKISFLESKEVIRSIASMQKEAVIRQTSDMKFKRELSQWLRLNNTQKDDGMPGFTVGLMQTQARVAKILMPRIPAFTKMLGKKDKVVINSSPLVGIVTNSGESISDWINTGRTYQEIALTAALLDISMTPLHSIVEDKLTSPKLARLFGLKAGKPQMFFRLGYNSTTLYHTPRRHIDKSFDKEAELQRVINPNIELDKVKIGKYKINYAKVGRGKPLVLIHGGNIGWGQWYPNINQLAKYFTLYMPDLPGGGRSTRVDFNDIDFEKDLVEVVEEFIKNLGLGKVDIAGASIGGWLVAKLSLRSPKSYGKIVMADAIGFSDYVVLQDRIFSFYPLAKLITKTIANPVRENDMIETVLRSVFYNPNLYLKREFIEYFYETMKTSHNLLFISRMARDMKKLSLVNQLKNIKNKSLIIWGEHDKSVPLQKNRHNFSLIPNVKIKILKEAGHICSIEKSKQFNISVINFLR